MGRPPCGYLRSLGSPVSVKWWILRMGSYGGGSYRRRTEDDPLARHCLETWLRGRDPRAVLGRHRRRSLGAQFEGVPGDRHIVFLLKPIQTGGYQKAIWSDKVRPDVDPRGHTDSLYLRTIL